jgi:hypothetical protein
MTVRKIREHRAKRATSDVQVESREKMEEDERLSGEAERHFNAGMTEISERLRY